MLYTSQFVSLSFPFTMKLTSIGVRSSRILSAELTHSFTSKLSSENLEKSMSMFKNKNKKQNNKPLPAHISFAAILNREFTPLITSDDDAHFFLLPSLQPFQNGGRLFASRVK